MTDGLADASAKRQVREPWLPRWKFPHPALDMTLSFLDDFVVPGKAFSSDKHTAVGSTNRSCERRDRRRFRGPGVVLPWRAGLGGKRVEKCAEEEHPSCVSMGKRGWERRLGPGERREEEERLGPRPKSLFLGARPGRPVLGAPRCGSLRNATSPPDPRSVLRVRHEACRGARSANTS